MSHSLRENIRTALQTQEACIHTAHGIFPYAALQRCSEMLAQTLPATQTVIFSLCGTGAESLCVLLFSLLHGHTFFPLNPAAEAETLRAATAGLSGIVITDKKHAAAVGSVIKDMPLFVLDAQTQTVQGAAMPDTRLPLPPAVQDAPYIYATSGSTGTGKRVIGRAESLRDFLEWEIACFSLNRQDRFVQVTRPFFDPYLRETLVPVLCGADIYIPPENIFLNNRQFAAYLTAHAITVWHTIPSVLRKLMALPAFDGKDLRCILLAGEILYGEDVRTFFARNQNTQLVNLYGPTETTLAKFYKCLCPADAQADIMPVGQPIGRRLATHAVLTADGEIIIQTQAASGGYLETPQSPAFYEENGLTCFRTQDSGYINAQGDLVVCGRMDDIVKYHGEKVNLHTLAACIQQAPCVADCRVVCCREGTETVFVAAVTAAQEKTTEELIRQQATEWLHAQQIPVLPSVYILFEALPCLPNGKTDRNAIQQIFMRKMQPTGDNQTNLTAAQDTFKTICSLVREEAQINAYHAWKPADRLIDLGVDSLSVFGILAAIEDVFDCMIEEETLEFHRLTLGDLAALTNNRGETV